MYSLAQDFGPGTVGVGERFGLWGHGGPTQVAISMTPGFHAGGAGVSDRIGFIGFGGPSEVMFSLAPDFRAGLLGAGDTGIWGAVLPREHEVSSPPPRRAAVLGTAPNDAIALLGENPDGVALRAVGTTELLGDVVFATAGRGIIGAGQRMATVADPNVHANSHLQVTVTSNPGSLDAVLQYARASEGSLRVVLAAPVTQTTRFDYVAYLPA
jgi:hypothetical protein